MDSWHFVFFTYFKGFTDIFYWVQWIYVQSPLLTKNMHARPMTSTFHVVWILKVLRFAKMFEKYGHGFLLHAVKRIHSISIVEFNYLFRIKTVHFVTLNGWRLFFYCVVKHHFGQGLDSYGRLYFLHDFKNIIFLQGKANYRRYKERLIWIIWQYWNY